MRKYFPYILILIVLTGIFSPVTHVEAATLPTCNDSKNPTNTPCTPPKPYVLLAPLPDPNNPGKNLNSDGGFYPSDTNSLGRYLNLMIKIIIGLSAVMAGVMIVIGGMEYMTSELISSKEEGKKRIQGALLGLLLALGAYALLFTINPDLLNSDVAIPDATVAVDLKDQNNDVAQGCSNNLCAGYPQGANWADIAGVPAPLPPNVTASPSGDCATVGQTGCTSIRGLLTGYVSVTQQGCNCPLTITGGTESWAHSAGTAHGPGSPVVDLAKTTELTRYIMGGDTQPTSFTRYSKNGVSYLYEGTHWHVGG